MLSEQEFTNATEQLFDFLKAYFRAMIKQDYMEACYKDFDALPAFEQSRIGVEISRSGEITSTDRSADLFLEELKPELLAKFRKHFHMSRKPNPPLSRPVLRLTMGHPPY